jgi:hypothetical protein
VLDTQMRELTGLQALPGSSRDLSGGANRDVVHRP